MSRPATVGADADRAADALTPAEGVPPDDAEDDADEAAQVEAEAEAALPELRTAVQERYGVDLDDPSTTVAIADRHSVLVVVHYYVGVLELVHNRNPQLAAEHFAAAAAVGATPEPDRGDLSLKPKSTKSETLRQSATPQRHTPSSPQPRKPSTGSS